MPECHKTVHLSGKSGFTRKSWTAAEDAVVREQFAAGASDYTIAALLCRSYTSVRVRRTKVLGLCVPRSQRKRWSQMAR